MIKFRSQKFKYHPVSGYIWLEGKGRGKDKREAGRWTGTLRPFRKGEFNPSETNTESHKMHQTNVWEGNQRDNKAVKRMVYLVMRHLTKNSK